jgi:mannose-6-phosphate isomerase-like protein (cupin superfamily)
VARIDYRNKWVKKPWGRERCIHEQPDGSVAVWHLRIDPGQSTSMHMHRIKKTALVVLGGFALVRFMSGEMKLDPMQKVRFAPGQYHQTFAYHPPHGLDLLEVETPSDKNDLVRLEDQYGRAGKGYEGPEAFEEDKEVDDWRSRTLGDCIIHKNLIQATGHVGEVEAEHPTVLRDGEHGVVIFLSGGVKRGTMPVFSPGDVVDASTLRRLAVRYDLQRSEVLEVSRA